MSNAEGIIRRSRVALRAFFETEASGGVLLFIAATAAMLWANLLPAYEDVWHTKLRIAGFDYDLRHWINDGLMAIFFLVVGLEIKREFVSGEIRGKVAALPIVAAVGGMVLPALLYLAINPSGEAARGWAIPMATDIAFVLGALSLLGPRVPDGLRLFLLTLAIADDVGAIVVIALFYSRGLHMQWLGLVVVALAVILVLRRLRIAPPVLYLLPAVALWVGAAKVGIHPTLAGVTLGLLTPAGPVSGRRVLEELERGLHPISSYVVVPVFALANTGVVLGGAMGDVWSSTIVWGIVAGLVVGKAVGILGAARLGEATRIASRPPGVSWAQVGGGSVLSGIGFTVSLFITGLAFTSQSAVDLAKIGVLVGSAFSALFGISALVLANRTVDETAGP